MYEQLEREVKEAGEQVEIEGCARRIAEIKGRAKEARDPSFNQ